MPVFPQTLLVQPNAEILAYRQGLTPHLIATLSRFAQWKGLGPACTLELTAEQTYQGLESGLTLPMMLQALARHSSRLVPPAVADLLQRWSSKRERITVFASAVLVEFATAAELETAMARGIVAVRLTDRIGMTAEGTEPGLTQLRLIANRDYEAKPQRCVTVGDDGVTLTIDAAAADLLLDAEIGRFAEPMSGEPTAARRFRLTAEQLRRAADTLSLADIDGWFGDRTGQPLSPAGRLLLIGPQSPPPVAARLLVVRFSTPELADGAMQWPETRGLIAERLGPTAIAVAEENLEALSESVGRHRDQNGGLASIPLPFPLASQQYPQTPLNHSCGCSRCPIASTASRVSLLSLWSARHTPSTASRRSKAVHPQAKKLPYSLKILLENLLRNENGLSVRKADIDALAQWQPKVEPVTEIAYTPARVLMQDFTGVPCVVDLAAMRDAMKALGGDPAKINPQVPVELVIDHSVQVDEFGTPMAFDDNVKYEYERNQERYTFLRWGQNAFGNFQVVPPGTGICHQVNLEYLARCVFVDPHGVAYPDTLVGTDSHTTMVNGLGVLGWGVGGIEAEAAMLNQPVSMLIPQVVGFKLSGKLSARCDRDGSCTHGHADASQEGSGREVR